MKMNSNCNTTQRLDEAQQASHRLEVVHREMAKALSNGQKDLNEFWKGNAAESATAGLNPLIQTSGATAERLQGVRESMYEQNSVFHETRGSLRPVSTERPDDSGLFDYMSIGASDAEKAAAQWDNDSRHNIAQYDGYARITEANRSRVAVEHAPVDASPGAGGITTPQSTGSVTQATGSGPSVGTGSGYNGPTSSSGYSGGTGSPVAPSPQVQNPAPAPPPQHQVPPAAKWQPPGDGTTPSRVAPAPPGGGQRPGYMPPRGGYDANRNPGFGPPGGGSGFGPVGTGGGSGSAGGFGPRGSGGSGYGGGARGFGPTGGAPGSGAQPGMGRGTGAVMPGENPAARGGAAGSAGATGGRGSGMMGGPMGAGGRGGKGSEDEEHQRKITLPGDDPDSLFGGHYERTTPPVIGEQKN